MAAMFSMSEALL